MFCKRVGSTANLRLGPIQIAETNDEGNTPNSNQRHGKALCFEHDLSRIDDGFDLMRAILLHAKKQQENRRIANLTSNVGGENEENNCGTFLDELKLVCTCTINQA